jgi:N-acetylmuramoyl-L-alanine amidase
MMLMHVLAATAALQAGSLPVQAVVRDGARPVVSAKSGVTARGRVAARPSKNIHRVIVDAGHGGVDPGAPIQGGRLHEKDVALQVALKVGATLRDSGVDVVYTRMTDTLIGRADRGRIANHADGDVFISIHVNAANPRWRDPGAARGFETYFLGVAKTEDAQRVEEMEEQSVRFESRSASASGDPLGFILNDMMQNEHLRESSDLAEIVQRHLRGVHPGPDRGVKQAGFTVLVSAFMPAILVEIGFGTNVEEARFISSGPKQRALADAIAAATREYLQRHERRVGGGAASSGAHD